MTAYFTESTYCEKCIKRQKQTEIYVTTKHLNLTFLTFSVLHITRIIYKQKAHTAARN